jgi:1-acyl-sn-glycerol-3-phosphate acyltransferase
MSGAPGAPGQPSGAVGTILATLAGNASLIAGSLVLGLTAVLLSWVPPRGSWALATFRLWARLLLATSGVRVAAHYSPELRSGVGAGARYVFLSNHQSLYDIPVLLATVPGPLRMVAKRSLFRIPIFGWALAAGGFIPVDRTDRSTARETFAAAQARVREGASLLLFPEGTRAPEDTLLPFQRGGFLLALKSGLPIVPVGIQATRRIRRRGGWVIHPGPAIVRYGAPIDPGAYGVRRKPELMAEVRRQIAELAGLGLGAEEPAEAAAAD